MQEYVVVYLHPQGSHDTLLVVLKDRPIWQKGRINLPGGKVESGETPERAAARELLEETGFCPSLVRRCGTIVGSWGVVHCFESQIPVSVYTSQPVKPRNGETEKFYWEDWTDLQRDARLIPNLKVVVSLMRAGVEDWVVADEGHSVKGKPHQFAVTI